MISAGRRKNTTRNTKGGPPTSHLSVRFERRQLLRQDDARFGGPSSGDRVTDFEELRPARRVVGKQRLHALAVLQVDDVGSDVADVKKIAYFAGMAVRQIESGADGGEPHLLGTKRERGRRSRPQPGGASCFDFAQPGDAQPDALAVHRDDLAVEQVDLADEIGNEAVPGKAVQPRRLVELLDAD